MLVFFGISHNGSPCIGFIIFQIIFRNQRCRRKYNGFERFIGNNDRRKKLIFKCKPLNRFGYFFCILPTLAHFFGTLIMISVKNARISFLEGFSLFLSTQFLRPVYFEIRQTFGMQPIAHSYQSDIEFHHVFVFGKGVHKIEILAVGMFQAHRHRTTIVRNYRHKHLFCARQLHAFTIVQIEVEMSLISFKKIQAVFIVTQITFQLYRMNASSFCIEQKFHFLVFESHQLSLGRHESCQRVAFGFHFRKSEIKKIGHIVSCLLNQGHTIVNLFFGFRLRSRFLNFYHRQRIANSALFRQFFLIRTIINRKHHNNSPNQQQSNSCIFIHPFSLYRVTFLYSKHFFLRALSSS